MEGRFPRGGAGRLLRQSAALLSELSECLYTGARTNARSVGRRGFHASLTGAREFCLLRFDGRRRGVASSGSCWRVRDAGKWGEPLFVSLRSKSSLSTPSEVASSATLPEGGAERNSSLEDLRLSWLRLRRSTKRKRRLPAAFVSQLSSLVAASEATFARPSLQQTPPSPALLRLTAALLGFLASCTDRVLQKASLEEENLLLINQRLAHSPLGLSPPTSQLFSSARERERRVRPDFSKCFSLNHLVAQSDAASPRTRRAASDAWRLSDSLVLVSAKLLLQAFQAEAASQGAGGVRWRAAETTSSESAEEPFFADVPERLAALRALCRVTARTPLLAALRRPVFAAGSAVLGKELSLSCRFWEAQPHQPHQPHQPQRPRQSARGTSPFEDKRERGGVDLETAVNTYKALLLLEPFLVSEVSSADARRASQAEASSDLRLHAAGLDEALFVYLTNSSREKEASSSAPPHQEGFMQAPAVAAQFLLRPSASPFVRREVSRRLLAAALRISKSPSAFVATLAELPSPPLSVAASSPSGKVPLLQCSRAALQASDALAVLGLSARNALRKLEAKNVSPLETAESAALVGGVFSAAETLLRASPSNWISWQEEEDALRRWTSASPPSERSASEDSLPQTLKSLVYRRQLQRLLALSLLSDALLLTRRTEGGFRRKTAMAVLFDFATLLQTWRFAVDGQGLGLGSGGAEGENASFNLSFFPPRPPQSFPSLSSHSTRPLLLDPPFALALQMLSDEDPRPSPAESAESLPDDFWEAVLRAWVATLQKKLSWLADAEASSPAKPRGSPALEGAVLCALSSLLANAPLAGAAAASLVVTNLATASDASSLSTLVQAERSRGGKGGDGLGLEDLIRLSEGAFFKWVSEQHKLLHWKRTCLRRTPQDSSLLPLLRREVPSNETKNLRSLQASSSWQQQGLEEALGASALVFQIAKKAASASPPRQTLLGEAAATASTVQPDCPRSVLAFSEALRKLRRQIAAESRTSSRPSGEDVCLEAPRAAVSAVAGGVAEAQRGSSEASSETSLRAALRLSQRALAAEGGFRSCSTEFLQSALEDLAVSLRAGASLDDSSAEETQSEAAAENLAADTDPFFSVKKIQRSELAATPPRAAQSTALGLMSSGWFWKILLPDVAATASETLSASVASREALLRSLLGFESSVANLLKRKGGSGAASEGVVAAAALKATRLASREFAATLRRRLKEASLAPRRELRRRAQASVEALTARCKRLAHLRHSQATQSREGALDEKADWERRRALDFMRGEAKAGTGELIRCLGALRAVKEAASLSDPGDASLRKEEEVLLSWASGFVLNSTSCLLQVAAFLKTPPPVALALSLWKELLVDDALGLRPQTPSPSTGVSAGASSLSTNQRILAVQQQLLEALALNAQIQTAAGFLPFEVAEFLEQEWTLQPRAANALFAVVYRHSMPLLRNPQALEQALFASFRVSQEQSLAARGEGERGRGDSASSVSTLRAVLQNSWQKYKGAAIVHNRKAVVPLLAGCLERRRLSLSDFLLVLDSLAVIFANTDKTAPSVEALRQWRSLSGKGKHPPEEAVCELRPASKDEEDGARLLALLRDAAVFAAAASSCVASPLLTRDFAGAFEDARLFTSQEKASAPAERAPLSSALSASCVFAAQKRVSEILASVEAQLLLQRETTQTLLKAIDDSGSCEGKVGPEKASLLFPTFSRLARDGARLGVALAAWSKTLGSSNLHSPSNLNSPSTLNSNSAALRLGLELTRRSLAACRWLVRIHGDALRLESSSLEADIACETRAFGALEEAGCEAGLLLTLLQQQRGASTLQQGLSDADRSEFCRQVLQLQEGSAVWVASARKKDNDETEPSTESPSLSDSDDASSCSMTLEERAGTAFSALLHNAQGSPVQIGALRLPGVLGSVLEEDASQGQGRQAQERGPPPQILFAFVSPSDSREKRTDSLRAKLLLRLQACQWLGFRVVPVGLWELRGRSAEEVHSIAKNYVHSAAQTGVTA